MPGLHDASMLAGKLQNAVRISQARGQRLLDQKVDTRSQQRLRGRRMMHRRHTDRSSIKRPRRQTRLDRLEAGYTKPLRGLRSNARVAVDHSNKLDRLPRLLKLTIYAKMVAPEGPCSNNGDAKWIGRRHYFFSTGASTT
jgi:hypothetical protein